MKRIKLIKDYKCHPAGKTLFTNDAKADKLEADGIGEILQHNAKEATAVKRGAKKAK